jgi:hypothetical protein
MKEKLQKLGAAASSHGRLAMVKLYLRRVPVLAKIGVIAVCAMAGVYCAVHDHAVATNLDRLAGGSWLGF